MYVKCEDLNCRKKQFFSDASIIKGIKVKVLNKHLHNSVTKIVNFRLPK